MKINKIVLGIILLMLWSCSETPKQNSETEKQQETTEQQVSQEQEIKTKGDSIVKIAFKTLSSRLKNAMATGGVEAAIEVCSKDAMRLTDSLSKELGVKIKRTSHKVRNLQNAPDEWETKVINYYLEKMQNNEPLEPYVEKTNGKWRYAKPIKIKPQCLTCHGNPQGKVKELIEKYYPDDQATGFKEGDLRGIWSIEM